MLYWQGKQEELFMTYVLGWPKSSCELFQYNAMEKSKQNF